MNLPEPLASRPAASPDASASPGPSPDSEGRRFERARAGDRSAQEELLRTHYARVHATAFRLLGNPEDAEDLAQECFVRAFRSLAFYRGEGSFAGWLRRILVHLAQDRYRARGQRPEPGLLPRELPATLGTGREPHGVLEGRELGRVLADALATLAAPQRIALLLRTREGLEYEEIAGLTSVTPATARTRVMKARKLLQRLLAPYLGPCEATRAARAAERPVIRCRVARAYVHAGLERALALEERFQLELHTASCPGCAEFERHARGLQELLEGPGDPPPSPPDVEAASRAVFAELARGPGGASWPRRATRPARIAAGLLALAAAVLVFVYARGRPDASGAERDAGHAGAEHAGAEPAPVPGSEWSAASVESSVRTALLELFDSNGVDPARAREGFLERMREPARAGWPVRRFVEGLLESPDVEVALGATRCLAALGEASSAAALERALSRAELAECALDSLGTLGAPAIPALERALAEPALASRSLLQLCRVGGARAAGALERAVEAARPDSDPSREALLDALTTTGPAAVASLLRLAAEGERRAGRAEGTAILARLPLVAGGGPELALCLERERLPHDLAYRALLFLQPPEALAWLEERCAGHRERALALDALASFPGTGPLGVALRLAERGRVPREDVRALLVALFERDLEHGSGRHGDAGSERAEDFTRELIALGEVHAIHAWVELLIESEHRGAARALVPLVFCEQLAEDDRQWAALAVGELGTAFDAERLHAELGARLAEDRRRTAACLLSIHAKLGTDGVARVLERCSPTSVSRVLAALESGGSGEAVLVHRVARALDGALAELAGDSTARKEIL